MRDNPITLQVSVLNGRGNCAIISRAISMAALRDRINGRCEICKFSAYNVSTDTYSNRWRCHRYPPERIPKGGLIALLGFWGLGGVNWEFPTVQPDWVCGGFAPSTT